MSLALYLRPSVYLISELDLPDPPGSLNRNFCAHFRYALRPVGKMNWYLGHSQAGFLAQVSYFNLKSVTVGAYFIERQFAQSFRPKHFKAGGSILHL